MGRENLGTAIREFFTGLLGSRLNAHLEEELLRTREDYESRLLEYVHQQAGFREQISQLTAKIEKYEMVLLPMVYGNLGGPRKPPTFDPLDTPDPNSWPAIQARWEKSQEAEDQAADKPS